jgi:hypothetical protein
VEAAELLADSALWAGEGGVADVADCDEVVAEDESPPLPAVVSALLDDLLVFAEPDVAVDAGLGRADFAVLSAARTGDAVEDRPLDPVDADPAAGELAEAPDEPVPAPAAVLEPSSAWAIPDPLARAAPRPSVMAPAPSHA